MSEIFKLRFFNCMRDHEKDPPEFRCEIEAEGFEEADDKARAKFDVPTDLCCCGLAKDYPPPLLPGGPGRFTTMSEQPSAGQKVARSKYSAGDPMDLFLAALNRARAVLKQETDPA